MSILESAFSIGEKVSLKRNKRVGQIRAQCFRKYDRTYLVQWPGGAKTWHHEGELE